MTWCLNIIIARGTRHSSSNNQFSSWWWPGSYMCKNPPPPPPRRQHPRSPQQFCAVKRGRQKATKAWLENQTFFHSDKSRQNTRAMAFERELAEKISRLATSYKDEALWFQLKIICFCFSAAPALLHLSTTRIMTWGEAHTWQPNMKNSQTTPSCDSKHQSNEFSFTHHQHISF